MAAVLSWAIFACRTPYAAEVAEIVLRRGENIRWFVDNLADDQSAPTEGAIRVVDLPRSVSDVAAVVPLLTPGHRFNVQLQARTAGFSSFPLLLDTTSVIASSASVGEGTVVNAAAVVGANSEVGKFVHVNRSASIGHDNVVADFSSIGPGCVMAGGVIIERGAFLGAGVVCAPNVRVGDNAVVGAGAVVIRDVPSGSVVVGNPARSVAAASGGYGGMQVPSE